MKSLNTIVLRAVVMDIYTRIFNTAKKRSAYPFARHRFMLTLLLNIVATKKSI